MIRLAMLLFMMMPAPEPASRIEADAKAVERAAAALDPHVEGIWLDGKAGTARLAETQWKAVQTWSADWLDAHQGASAAAFVAASARFGDGWHFSAVSLGRGEMLVSAARYQMGNAFILDRSGPGGYRLRWSTAAAQTRLNAEADRALAQWRPMVQNGACRLCRMIGVTDVGLLPPAADGSARFWLHGGYAQEIGATRGVQLSLWSWRDGRARPLLVHDFTVMADQKGPVLRGTILHVPSKGEWDSIYACGACFGRTVDLPFAIDPNGVRALPAISRTPELDLIDRVYARILTGRPVGAVAAPAALTVIRKHLRDALAEPDPELRKLAGMVAGWQRWTVRGEHWVCLSVDGVGPLAFAFDRALTQITAARPLAAGACQGGGTRM